MIVISLIVSIYKHWNWISSLSLTTISLSEDHHFWTVKLIEIIVSCSLVVGHYFRLCNDWTFFFSYSCALILMCVIPLTKLNVLILLMLEDSVNFSRLVSNYCSYMDYLWPCTNLTIGPTGTIQSWLSWWVYPVGWEQWHWWRFPMH